jgi:hypothetical protein
MYSLFLPSRHIAMSMARSRELRKAYPRHKDWLSASLAKKRDNSKIRIWEGAGRFLVRDKEQCLAYQASSIRYRVLFQVDLKEAVRR